MLGILNFKAKSFGLCTIFVRAYNDLFVIHVDIVSDI